MMGPGAISARDHKARTTIPRKDGMGVNDLLSLRLTTTVLGLGLTHPGVVMGMASSGQGSEMVGVRGS